MYLGRRVGIQFACLFCVLCQSLVIQPEKFCKVSTRWTPLWKFEKKTSDIEIFLVNSREESSGRFSKGSLLIWSSWRNFVACCWLFMLTFRWCHVTVPCDVITWLLYLLSSSSNNKHGLYLEERFVLWSAHCGIVAINWWPLSEQGSHGWKHRGLNVVVVVERPSTQPEHEWP